VTSAGAVVEVGVDLGGTATRVVVRHDDVTVGHTTVTTSDLGKGSPDQRARSLWSVIKDIVSTDMDLSSIGIAASGPIDVRTGIIENADTLEWFSGFNLVGLMAALSGVPVLIENDAVAAAIGEYQHGAGRDAERLLLVTLGTGIGVALLEHGQPFRQFNGQHPDSGHIPVFGDNVICYCGLTGCWEQSASRLALERALSPLHSGEVSPTELISLISAKARGGDEMATEAFVEYGRKVGRGIALLHTVYGPSVTVIGGTVANTFDLFSSGMNQSLTRADGFYLPVDIVRAELGPEAGAIGAAALAKDRSSEKPSVLRKAT
jgi:glucokinase